MDDTKRAKALSRKISKVTSQLRVAQAMGDSAPMLEAERRSLINELFALNGRINDARRDARRSARAAR